ncbi:Sin3 associated polypeptide p18-domain-containing protein [Jimgerdemannia flammicorona]|uniref:Sin3 associated polypeptide p18-domain-containing protein n=2 Tax=Jimgerdemannia flammicorona TaxID=994334 RepID=A0A433Q712_9FUNG|nr:Sin3 associated polypeptide p18-domain-containing protein [Jimgerdemannia flammicorona]RUS25566.1 Sin3 associated polypeptide p18-domain-containing protein [Jimgerdemannia flammicorona]
MATDSKTAGSSKKISVDREKTCPFLLRLFWRTGTHHRNEEFDVGKAPVQDELQIYTWKDATLHELALLLKEVQPEATRPQARISFRLVYLDNLRGRYMFKDIGVVMNSRSTAEEQKTLDDIRFVTGDFIDVCVAYGTGSGAPGTGGGRLGGGGFVERRGSWDRDGPRNGGGSSGGGRFSGRDDTRVGRGAGGDRGFNDRDREYGGRNGSGFRGDRRDR